MPKLTRRRTIAAPPERVWELVSDPDHMSRWWPGVARMEGVVEDRFTQVHMTKKGRGIRIDFQTLDAEPPHDGRPGVFRFGQEIIGTPFERVLRDAITEITVAPAAPEQTDVQIQLIQKLRGTSRLGGFMLRRASGPRLDEALENLERLLV